MTDKTTAAEHAECLINAATEVESIDTVECAILGVTMRNAAAELTRLAERREALERRLELSATAGDGSKVKLDIGDCDGIGCRDETIKLLDAKVARLAQSEAALRERVEVDALQRTLFAWSSATFGDAKARGPEGPLNHLRKEIDEALSDPSDLVEFADMYMLLSDAASRAGHRMSDVLTASVAKLEVNKARKWGKPNADGFSEHVRDTDPTP